MIFHVQVFLVNCKSMNILEDKGEKKQQQKNNNNKKKQKKNNN